MPEKDESGIFKDPRRNRKEPESAGDANDHKKRRKRFNGERRNRCFSSSPWWLRRNYLDHE